MPRVKTVRFDPEAVKRGLERCGCTPTEVAAKAGISVSTLNKGMGGGRIGRLVARSIAQVLKTPVSALLSADETAAA